MLSNAANPSPRTRVLHWMEADKPNQKKMVAWKINFNGVSWFPKIRRAPEKSEFPIMSTDVR